MSLSLACSDNGRESHDIDGVPHDIVVVLVNGLRADASNTPGAENAFFEAADLPDGLRFNAAYAQAPTPFLSMAAVLSGQYPSALPLCGPKNTSTANDKPPSCFKIPDNVYTLPEILAAHDYQTHLVTDGIPGAERLEENFSSWNREGQPTASDPPFAEEVRTHASTWWNATEGPRLLVVALGDLSLDQKYAIKTEIGLTANSEALTEADQLALNDRATEVYWRLARESGEHVRQLIESLEPHPERPKLTIVGGLSGTSLAETSPYPGQPVPLLSSGLLLDRTLRVPLYIHGPNIDAGTVTEPVELLDILPTVTHFAGVKERPQGIVGTDLTQPQPAEDPVAYSQFGDMRSIRMGPYLLTWRAFIHGAGTLDPRVSDGIATSLQIGRGLFLHDVTQDALQQSELKTSHPDVLRALLVELYRREHHFAAPEHPLSPEELDVLRSSDGYW